MSKQTGCLTFPIDNGYFRWRWCSTLWLGFLSSARLGVCVCVVCVGVFMFSFGRFQSVRSENHVSNLYTCTKFRSISGSRSRLLLIALENKARAQLTFVVDCKISNTVLGWIMQNKQMSGGWWRLWEHFNLGSWREAIKFVVDWEKRSNGTRH